MNIEFRILKQKNNPEIYRLNCDNFFFFSSIKRLWMTLNTLVMPTIVFRMQIVHFLNDRTSAFANFSG